MADPSHVFANSPIPRGESFTQMTREDKAREEHARPSNHMCMPPDVVAERFGEGIAAYFHYSRVLLAANFFTMILQIICYCIFDRTSNIGSNWYNMFFISTFQTGQKNIWIGINSGCIIISGIALPAFLFYRRGADKEPSNQKEKKDAIVRYTTEGKIDVSHHFRGTGSKVIRILFSIFIFGALLLVQVIVSFYVTKIEETSTSDGISFLIAIIVSVLNLVYSIIADYLTEMEKPRTLHGYKVSITSKLLLFKLGNVITVYTAKNYSKVKDCAYNVIGQQFLYMLVVDITLNNFLELAVPHLTSKFWIWMAMRDKNNLQSDQDLLPPFDVAYEYLDVIYRQYILYMAMTVFPLAAPLAWLGQLVEYWLDRMKLFKFTGKPKSMEYSTTEGVMIMLFQFLALMAALFTPYAGVVWILRGDTKHTTAVKCMFP